MKAEILIEQQYGFLYYWTLSVSTAKKHKKFFLGQDEKVCRRLLGMTGKDVVEALGTNDINEGTRGNKRLAKMICKAISLTGHNIDKIENWEICVE